MKSAFRMWNNTRMIILVAVCAAIYGSALIAFKTAIPLIPGITEVRVANIFPMVFGLLFGPAGAWGTAIGNLIGDVFGGTLGPGSIAGFVGNFLLGYLPYTMWMTFLPFLKISQQWRTGEVSCWVNYFLIAFISSASCAVVISTFVDTLGIVPYGVLVKIITINNTLGSWIGVILLSSVFNLIANQLGLFWPDVMEESNIGPSIVRTLGAWMVTAGSMVGLFGEMTLHIPSTTHYWISTFIILIGSLLL